MLSEEKFNLLQKIICTSCGGANNKILKSFIYCKTCKKNLAIVLRKDKLDFLLNSEHNKLGYHGTDPTKKFNQSNWTEWRKSNFEFLKSLNLLPPIIDIGSGPGVFHSIFKDVLSIDFMNYDNVNIITDLNCKIPLCEDMANSIILSNFLEHIYDPKTILNECYRLLKMNSILFITVPFMLKVHQEPFDFHRYTYIYLMQILNEIGFQIEEIRCLPDNQSFHHLSESYYQFKIAKGSLVAKFLWQIQKLVHLMLNKFSLPDQRLDYTVGYMIVAKKV